MKFGHLLPAILVVALAGCETVVDKSDARYDKIQREVDAYYRCGIGKAFGLATTRETQQSIAAIARGACAHKRRTMLSKMQHRYPSAAWTRFTIAIDDTFKDLAMETVVARRIELEERGLRPRLVVKRALPEY